MLNSASGVLELVLTRERSLIAETETFEDLKHNDDLCPKLQRQVEMVLNAFGRFEPITYDTQGFRDDGVDLAVRCERERKDLNEEAKIIGFQIKSFSDFRDKNLIRNLKAQHHDARTKVNGLGDYYILLCTNERRDKPAIRAIEAEFRSVPSTFVIEPTYAYRFLTLPQERVEGLIARVMEAGDIVYKRALEAVDVGRVSASLLAVFVAAMVLAGFDELRIEQLANDPLLGRCYDDLRAAIVRQQLASEEQSHNEDDNGRPEDNFAEHEDLEDDEKEDQSRLELTVESISARDLLSIDLEVLSTYLVDMDSARGIVRPRLPGLMPVIALLADALVRYELPVDNLALYGINALGLLDG